MLINDKHPATKQAFWFRYRCSCGFGFCHVAIVANTLEEAFKKASDSMGVDSLEIEYRNRVIEVLL